MLHEVLDEDVNKIRFVYTNINNMAEKSKATAEVEVTKRHAEMIKTLDGRGCAGFSAKPLFFRREAISKTRVNENGLQGIIDELKPEGACVVTSTGNDKSTVMKDVKKEKRNIIHKSMGNASYDANKAFAELKTETESKNDFVRRMNNKATKEYRTKLDDYKFAPLMGTIKEVDESPMKKSEVIRPPSPKAKSPEAKSPAKLPIVPDNEALEEKPEVKP